LPLTTGTASALHASAMPSIASENCCMTSGRSGLPKLRQSVRPIGSAPLQTTLRAHSATAIAAPARAESSHLRPSQSTESATCMKRSMVPSSRSQAMRTTAASLPGRTTVPPRTM
jgi:hypothetical protein